MTYQYEVGDIVKIKKTNIPVEAANGKFSVWVLTSV